MTPSPPYFDGDYAAAMLSLGEECPHRPEDFENRHPEVDGIPAIIAMALRATDKPRVSFRMLQKRCLKLGARKALESIGIHCEHHIMPETPTPRKITATVDQTPEAATVSVEPFDDKDDLEDPPVPPGTVETPEDVLMSRRQSGIPDALMPLAQGFCAYLQNKVTEHLTQTGIKLQRDAEKVLVEMADFTKGVLASNEHASYQLSDALLKGTTVISQPYQMTLQVTTPQGFPLTLTVTKTSAEELIGAMGKLDSWLIQNGYTVPVI